MRREDPDSGRPLVSVGVPAFNRPAELKRVLYQLVNQTYPNIEIIVLDDCSTLSEVEQVARGFAETHANVKYFRNERNLGVLKNAPELIKYANGKYFCWVSDDDWRAPEFIEILVTELENNKDVDMAFCDYREVQEDGSCATGYPLTHLEIFKPFQSRFRLVRTMNFYWQDASRGKCNIFYAIFRKDAIEALDLEKISGGYQHLNMDCLLVFSLLQAGPVAICSEVMCTLTCGNKKYYSDNAGRHVKSSLSRFRDFWFGHKKDRDLYISNSSLLVEKLIICLLFIPKVTILLTSFLLKKMMSRVNPALNTLPRQVRGAARQDGDQKINLPNVTLVAMATRNVEETLQALVYSCKGIKFGSVKLLSHYTPYGLDKDIEFIRIGKIKDIDEWSYKIIYELNEHIETDFALLVHADGFVVNPSSWRDKFLDYDYIGAPWPLPKDDYSYRDIHGNIFRVGNSVSLRSKRLLELPIKQNLPWEPYHGFYNEDGFICGKNRHIYESCGMRFAPLGVAKYFSHECMIPEIRGIKPFAFHKWAGTNKIYPKF